MVPKLATIAMAREVPDRLFGLELGELDCGDIGPLLGQAALMADQEPIGTDVRRQLLDAVNAALSAEVPHDRVRVPARASMHAPQRKRRRRPA